MLGSLVGKPIGDGLARPALRTADLRAERFRDLADRQLDSAYRLAAIILNDRIEAEDAVHDAAIAAWGGFDRLRDAANFDAWFRRILVNACRDRLRARTRRRVIDLGHELEAADHPAVDDVSSMTAERDAVDAALAQLSPEQHVVVVLRYHVDLTISQIAASLGIPEGTVKSRLHGALGRLRPALEEAGR